MQSVWLRAFWSLSQEPDSSQIWDLHSNIANNEYSFYRPNAEKNYQILFFLKNSESLFWKESSVMLIESNNWEFKLIRTWPGRKKITTLLWNWIKPMLFLFKLWHVLDKKTLGKSIMQFLSTKCYASLVRAQNTNLVIGVYLLHKKIPLWEWNISKLLSPLTKNAFDNYIFISKSLKGLLQFNLAAGSNFHLGGQGLTIDICRICTYIYFYWCTHDFGHEYIDMCTHFFP